MGLAYEIYEKASFSRLKFTWAVKRRHDNDLFVSGTKSSCRDSRLEVGQAGKSSSAHLSFNVILDRLHCTVIFLLVLPLCIDHKNQAVPHVYSSRGSNEPRNSSRSSMNDS